MYGLPLGFLGYTLLHGLSVGIHELPETCSVVIFLKDPVSILDLHCVLLLYVRRRGEALSVVTNRLGLLGSSQAESDLCTYHPMVRAYRAERVVNLSIQQNVPPFIAYEDIVQLSQGVCSPVLERA